MNRPMISPWLVLISSAMTTGKGAMARTAYAPATSLWSVTMSATISRSMAVATTVSGGTAQSFELFACRWVSLRAGAAVLSVHDGQSPATYRLAHVSIAHGPSRHFIADIVVARSVGAALVSALVRGCGKAAPTHDPN